jgi:hypothetical protein
LYSIGKKKSIKINDFLNVEIDKQPDLAYYLYYISKFGVKENSPILKIDDPKKEVRERAEKEEALVELKFAIWKQLSDEVALRKIAAAYGVTGTATKEPNKIRFDLEAQLEVNNKKKKRDPLVRGTREFLEEMKVTDNVRLRAFIKNLEDSKKLIYKPDGRYHLGEKTLLQVPYDAIGDTFGYVCNFYSVPNNADKLQELMRDVMNKEYLDNITDSKDLVWIAKIMGINTAFKKSEELKSMVYGAFSVAL